MLSRTPALAYALGQLGAALATTTLYTMDPSDPSFGTAAGHGYCIGDRVELHSLKGAAEHNGKRGTVTGSQNERIKVKLDGDKSLALKPVNLTKLEPPKPVVTKPPPPKARFAEPQTPAAFTDFYKEDKKEAPTSDDAEIRDGGEHQGI